MTNRPPLRTPEVIASLPPDGGPDFNRLVFEQSPYLLQHAANPVDWFPWGAEAFAKARAEDKPVFLSVGYATCHWCHVMERESFEDPEVAALLNAHFVCIKVDREERPDIDKIYMDVTQIMTGQGGWPMTVFMTADQKPFFTGTYFPKHGRYGRPGMMELLPYIAELWAQDRPRIAEVAARVTEALSDLASTAPQAEDLTVDTLHAAFRQLKQRFDAQHGGFGAAPKFPMPHALGFLLRYARRTGNRDAVNMVEATLLSMRQGGIYDHVGFGFHRYSTDAQWLLPHFEKMLYDQALMATACLEAFQATGRGEFAQTAREIFAYVLRDMTSPEGAFYSAEDADSEGVEGLFYLWTVAEVRRALPAAGAAWFLRTFQLQDNGNFRHEAGDENRGENIPHLVRSFAELAKDEGRTEDDLRDGWERLRTTLFAVREARQHPLKDDKILTDWNGLMIAALARGGAVLNETGYIDAACRAVDAVLLRLQDPRGRLRKRLRNGHAAGEALLEDYAFFIGGLLELYEACGQPRFLREAIRWTEVALAHFWDAAAGGFFQVADDAEALLVRAKEIYDGALPSGNSVMAGNLLRLSRLTGEPAYEEKAAQLFRAFAAQVRSGPASFCEWLKALDFALGPTREIVIACDRSGLGAQALRQAVHSVFDPNRVLLTRPEGEAAREVTALAPFAALMGTVEGRAAAYVCENHACRQPVTSAPELLDMLRRTVRA